MEAFVVESGPVLASMRSSVTAPSQWQNALSSGGSSSSSTLVRQSRGPTATSKTAIRDNLLSNLQLGPIFAIASLATLTSWHRRGRAARGFKSPGRGGVLALCSTPEGQENHGDQVKVKDREDMEKDLGYKVPSKEELESQEMELLKATGALHVQRKHEAYQARKKWRQQNPSALDRWQNQMDEQRNDTERRMLWGDLKHKPGGRRRYRGKQIEQKETEIKMNRGFPLEATAEEEAADARQDREWLDMWRAQWPEGEALDPHDPESFGFGFVGTVTGAFGISGEVRVVADEALCQEGYEPEKHLAYRNFSNWTQASKRVHLKSPSRRFPRPYRILSGKRVQRKVFALRLNGIESPDEAIAMRGYKVYVLEPPISAEEKAAQDAQMSMEGLYDANTTHFHTRDALELVGAKCVMLTGEVSEEVLGEFAEAETSKQAVELLKAAGGNVKLFGKLSAVVPDFKIARRYRGQKFAHDLLDITLVPEAQGGEGKYLYEPDPESPGGKVLDFNSLFEYNTEFERVTYVPFVPDVIARVESDHAGTTVYFTLPKGHLESTSYSCRKRFITEQGMLAIPRGPRVKALLPPSGKSHALRRRDGKRLPLHGTAPAPPADMPGFANQVFPEPAPGVPKPPLHRPRFGLHRDKNNAKKEIKARIAGLERGSSSEPL
eukprot:TRINITY_DN24015_c0_g1_i1.p1 TRINITY_DN24015_c0_g1~~TRINITY_DN24015_c0_g1_i1.p1  ORF type:complete len:664 (-),score=112.38 TRINITY_DN24015_c0_g1_i1:78-2069(-)